MNKPAVFAQYVWKESVLTTSDLVSMQWRRHAEILPVLGVGNLRRTNLKVHHGHDDVTLSKTLSVVAELVVRGELTGPAITVGVWFFTCQSGTIDQSDSFT